MHYVFISLLPLLRRPVVQRGALRHVFVDPVFADGSNDPRPLHPATGSRSIVDPCRCVREKTPETHCCCSSLKALAVVLNGEIPTALFPPVGTQHSKGQKHPGSPDFASSDHSTLSSTSFPDQRPIPRHHDAGLLAEVRKRPPYLQHAHPQRNPPLYRASPRPLSPDKRKSAVPAHFCHQNSARPYIPTPPSGPKTTQCPPLAHGAPSGRQWPHHHSLRVPAKRTQNMYIHTP